MAQYLQDEWQPFIAAGEIALHEQRLDDAALHFQLALLDPEFCRQSDRQVVTTLDLLSDTYCQLNRLEEAEEVSLRSLRIKQRAGTFSDFDILRAMFKLSKLYYYQSKLGAAAYTTKSLLELSEQTFGPSHPLVALVAGQLADLYYQLGSSREAKEFSQKSLAAKKKEFSNGSTLGSMSPPATAPICV